MQSEERTWIEFRAKNGVKLADLAKALRVTDNQSRIRRKR